MQFILDHQIRRLEGVHLDDLRLGPLPEVVCVMAALRMAFGSGDVPVTLAAAINTAKEGLNAAGPRHLSKLVDRCDDERGRAPVDLLVHGVRRDAVEARWVLGCEGAIVVGAVDLHCLCLVVVDVVVMAQRRPAPRAAEQLDRGSPLGPLPLAPLLQGLLGPVPKVSHRGPSSGSGSR